MIIKPQPIIKKSFKIVNIAKENKIDTIVIGKNDHYQGGRLD